MKLFEKYTKWLCLAGLLLLSAVLFLFPGKANGSKIRAAAESDVASVDGRGYRNLLLALANWRDGTTLTLLEDCATSPITVSGQKTLDLSGHTLSLREGETGSVLSVQGSLTLLGGGEIAGGNSALGGGIYVAGELSLRGGLIVENNLGSNLYLTKGNSLDANGFTGRAKVTLHSIDMPFAYGTGEFLSDDPAYSVVEENGAYRLQLSPLASLSVLCSRSEPVYPTTDLQSLRDSLSLTALNANGVEYPADKYEYALSGTLVPGESVIKVRAAGSGGEIVEAEFTVQVKVPSILSAEVMDLKQVKTLYFDSDPQELYEALEFTLVCDYEDGIRRRLLSTPEDTAALCGEDYIRDYYSLDADLIHHIEGVATGRLIVVSGQLGGIFDKSFPLSVSKRTVDLSRILAVEATVMEGEKVETSAFLSGLPAGITASAFIEGEPLVSESLSSGVYTVEFSFKVENENNYRLTGVSPKARLVVYARERRGSSGGFRYVVTREGGISPEWQFSISDVTGELRARLEDGFAVGQAFQLTFLPGESKDRPSNFTVRLSLSEELLAAEGLKLFRVNEDGAAEEIGMEREEDMLVFTAGDLLESSFVIAVPSNVGVYVTLAIVFGVLCVAGAGVLLWYFVFKKKIKLKG